MKIVASTFSKTGGRCGGCGKPIARHERIYKLDTGERGVTTSGGNGAGVWVGVCCAMPDTD